MIELKKEFKSGVGGNSTNPYLFKQIKRSKTAAIYKKTNPENPTHDMYEVFHIVIAPKGKKVFAKIYDDDTEVYPSTSSFGKLAWQVNSLDRANFIFDRLNTEAIDLSDIELLGEEEDAAPAPIVRKINVPTCSGFTVGELAAYNVISYLDANTFIKAGIAKGEIIFVREERRNAKGKMSNIYALNNGMIVPVVAPVVAAPTYVIPDIMPFSASDLAAANGAMQYVEAYQYIKQCVVSGSMVPAGSERRSARGKETSLYTYTGK